MFNLGTSLGYKTIPVYFITDQDNTEYCHFNS